MTVSILETLGALPDGSTDAINLTQLGEYLHKHYDTPSERDRNARHARRDVFYRDGGCEIMCQVVDKVFKDDRVRELRKEWVPFARFSNDVKRIVGEMSTVYAEPASRTVGGDAENVQRYVDLAAAVMLDEVMDEANRMVNLHRAILVGPRVRKHADGSRSMVIDIATPTAVRAVTHPYDASLVVGWLVKTHARPAHISTAPRVIAWQLWSDHEVIDLDEHLIPIGEPRAHGLGVCRWVPLTFNASSLPGFWPGEEGEDLIAAAISIWMSHILMLKETKSATTVPIISGDTTTMARQQAADTESPIEAPEGTSVTTVDMSMDTEIFTRAAEHVLERVGNSYGLSLTTLKHQGVQSAEAREILLEPLRALRRKQIKFFRRFEAELARVMAAVARVDLPALAFDATGFRIDFGEIQALTPKKQRMDEFDQAARLGIDNIIAMYRRENPDADEETARAAISENIAIRAWYVQEMQDFMRIVGMTKGEDPIGAVGHPVYPTGGRPPNDPTIADSPAHEAGDPPHVEDVAA